MAEDRHQKRASTLLDELTFGGHSQDGAQNVLADALASAEITGHTLGYKRGLEEMGAKMSEAEENAVFDFLNWLAPQNIELHQLIPGGCSEAVDGELLERWKTERHS
jgi:alpha-amylase/alpha-mannosidase (GH57 family)